MIRAFISLMLAFCFVATPLLIEQVDAHDAIGMDAIHHESDSHSDQDTNDPLHQPIIAADTPHPSVLPPPSFFISLPSAWKTS